MYRCHCSMKSTRIIQDSRHYCETRWRYPQASISIVKKFISWVKKKKILLRIRDNDESRGWWRKRSWRARSVSIFLDDACTLASILLLVFSHSRRRRLLCQTIPCGGPFKEFTKIDDSIQPSRALYHLFQSRISWRGRPACYWIIFWKTWS